jgi:3-dehydroquinate synthase
VVSGIARVVSLATYDVTIARGALHTVADVVRRVAPAHRYALITDSQVAPLYGDQLRSALGNEYTTLFSVPAGEEWKTRESWAALTDQMLGEGFGRDTTVIALGGGVVGDLAGFVAATFMRGVPFVQVPTTLLAMIDASIGGKTGVDTPAGKNLVGAFHHPAAVVADPDVLRTLPAAHLRAGLAEAIKHGVIADARYLESVVAFGATMIESDASEAALTDLVTSSVEIKADVVRRDERESGLRKTLNFGHTLGHAIELETGYRLLHGEAVAIGMTVESEIGEEMGIAERGTAAGIREAVARVGLPSTVPAGLSAEAIIRASHGDKKARAGRTEYALPRRIGAMAGESSGWSVPVPDEIVRAVLERVASGRHCWRTRRDNCLVRARHPFQRRRSCRRSRRISSAF